MHNILLLFRANYTAQYRLYTSNPHKRLNEISKTTAVPLIKLVRVEELSPLQDFLRI